MRARQTRALRPGSSPGCAGSPKACCRLCPQVSSAMAGSFTRPGHPSKHGANTGAAWSRPLREDHHDNRVTGLRLSGDRHPGAARAEDTVRNSRRVGPALGRGPRIDRSCTRDSPPVSPSEMPETLSNSECRYNHEHVGWLKTQVNRRGGVLAPDKRRTGPGVTSRCARSRAGRSRISAARTARSARSSRGRGWVRRSTATSCRSTRSSAFLEADDRPSRTSQPHSRTKMR
jgi:hypothetical protein